MTNLKKTNAPPIALFDFDGTLTRTDSFLAFLTFTHSRKEVLKNFLFLWPVLLLYKLKLISNAKAKARVTKRFYRGWPLHSFQKKAKLFCEQNLTEILKPDALKKMHWHQAQGHRVVVVSAMFEMVLKPWCQTNNVELLATRLQVENGKLTGHFSSPNCYGPEKATRIKTSGLLQNNPYVFAYGDSAGDLDMLALADEPFYQRF